MSVLYVTPAWYVPPRKQLELVTFLNEQRGWGLTGLDELQVPDGFMPTTSSEVLMLNVSLPSHGTTEALHWTFDELWELITDPDGLPKRGLEWHGLATSGLRLSPVYRHDPGVHWVGFDPLAYRDMAALTAFEYAVAEGKQLAGSQVLVAALLFPGWIDSWDGEESPVPQLSALRLDEQGCVMVPDMYRHIGEGPGDLSFLEMSRIDANSYIDGSASPTVRLL
ncbi:hypothetical protein JNJ66_03860 [Candidatus Saccharibacteria bacterium]|nr:hypothetical protein [Candidatus Saccharibacteria bacterium]